MRIETSMHQKLAQTQTMTLAPRMIQSMEILQLAIMDLRARVEQELEKNPVLELSDPANDDWSAPEENVTTEPVLPDIDVDGPMIHDADNLNDFSRLDALNRDWDDHFNEDHRPSRNGMDSEIDRKHDAMQNMQSRPQSLHDYLTEQLSFMELSPTERTLVEFLISHINDDGYLGIREGEEIDELRYVPYRLEDLVVSYGKPGVTVDDLEDALSIVQKLDPPGIAARDFKECLLLQVQPDTPHRDAIRALILNHLEDIRHNRMPIIQRKTGLELSAIKEAIEEMRRFNLRPGAPFEPRNTQYVLPDVIITQNDLGEYDIKLTEDWTPNVQISPRYFEMAKDRDADQKTRDYIKQKIQAASWLIDAIEQRRGTLEKVTRAIITHQRAFLDHGPESIKPLKMQQIADDVGVHVTTVSRAVDDKWVQTPRGLFPLKRFFGGGVESKNGEDVAYETIKQRLMELIGKEDKSAPLSDEDLVEKLNEAGYPVARRTVTKYRKMMKLPSSRQRKDWAIGKRVGGD